MANVKAIKIEAEVSWDWATRLDANEACLFTPISLNPVWGLRVEWKDLGYEPNENGGQTSMYLMRIVGTEAVRSTYLDAMIEAIEKTGGKVLSATEYDLDNQEHYVLR